jgi:NAD(P)-dependent dehydrogenase (short-subunit alcohol dehydrogenase family)
MKFIDKIVLITGGGNGIGRAAALGFAERGANVVVVDRDEAAARDTAEAVRNLGSQAHHVVADVSQVAQVRAYVAETLATFGRIDCFFNNAGVEGKVAPLAEYDEDVFDEVIAINLRGIFLGLRHVLPVMLEQGAGAVVNTSSAAGLVASPGMCAYVASKHAVLGLTKVAAGEVSSDGVRVNAVCPGPIDTRMLRGIAEQVSPEDPGALQESFASSVPVGRMGTAEEVANVVLFLCSDLASNVTGAHYVVDGGRLASPKGVTSSNNG